MVGWLVSQSFNQPAISCLYYLDLSKLPKSLAVGINLYVEFRMKCSGSKFSTQNDAHTYFFTEVLESLYST
jgi:hypothetical protein